MGKHTKSLLLARQLISTSSFGNLSSWLGLTIFLFHYPCVSMVSVLLRKKLSYSTTEVQTKNLVFDVRFFFCFFLSATHIHIRFEVVFLWIWSLLNGKAMNHLKCWMENWHFRFVNLCSPSTSVHFLNSLSRAVLQITFQKDIRIFTSQFNHPGAFLWLNIFLWKIWFYFNPLLELTF